MRGDILPRCKDCGQSIRWMITNNGKRMALDPQGGTVGNVTIEYRDAKGNEHGHVLKKDEDPVALRFVPHVATCVARRK